MNDLVVFGNSSLISEFWRRSKRIVYFSFGHSIPAQKVKCRFIFRSNFTRALSKKKGRVRVRVKDTHGKRERKRNSEREREWEKARDREIESEFKWADL